VLINRYIAREVVTNFIAVTSVLVLIYTSNRFVRYLADAAAGNLPTDLIFRLMFYKAVTSLAVLLPLGFFLAVLIGLGRFYRDNEITALAACGIGIGGVLRGLFKLSLAVGGLVLLVTCYVSPWAERQGEAIRVLAQANASFAGIASGRFNEMGDGNLVFYTQTISRDQEHMENVFAQSDRDGVTSVLTARQAQQQIDPVTGNRFLVFVEGFRYDGVPGTASFRMIRFGEHGVLVEKRDSGAATLRLWDRSTADLWGDPDPTAIGELQWRFAMPLSVVFLSLVAALLSKTDPRQGRFAKLFVAVVVYVVYSNLMGVARSWVDHGTVAPSVGLWWVHGLLVIFFAILWTKQMGWSWTRRQLMGRG